MCLVCLHLFYYYMLNFLVQFYFYLLKCINNVTLPKQWLQNNLKCNMHLGPIKFRYYYIALEQLCMQRSYVRVIKSFATIYIGFLSLIISLIVFVNFSVSAFQSPEVATQIVKSRFECDGTTYVFLNRLLRRQATTLIVVSTKSISLAQQRSANNNNGRNAQVQIFFGDLMSSYQVSANRGLETRHKY